jgi:hypothetical protein
MSFGFPVTTFPDTAAAVVQGLKTRFTESGGEFSSTRVATLKNQDINPQFEVIVLATGGNQENSGTTKKVPLSLLVFADEYGAANRLAAMTAEFLKSLPALKGPIRWVEVTNDGEHIENPGPQQCRNLIGMATVRANKTTIYYM